MTKAIYTAVAKWERSMSRLSYVAAECSEANPKVKWAETVADNAAQIVAMLVASHIKNGSTK